MAFWLKSEGAWDWRLHIISEAIDDSNSTDAQREGLRISDQMTYEGFDPFTVRLIPSHDWIAKAGIEAEHLSRGLPARHLASMPWRDFPSTTPTFIRCRALKLSGRPDTSSGVTPGSVPRSPLPPSGVRRPPVGVVGEVEQGTCAAWAWIRGVRSR